MAAIVGTCEAEGCSNDASMQCPKCSKLGMPPSLFCSQDCFKASWKEHKKIHKLAKAIAAGEIGKAAKSGEYNPYPSYNFSGPLRPHPQSPWRDVPADIVRPDYSEDGVPKEEQEARESQVIMARDAEEIEALREACVLGREILDIAGAMIRPGVKCDDIDRVVHQATIDRGGYPSPLNYNGFPKSVCTSVNEVICHGIPDMYELKDGDIVNVDVSIYIGGVHADLNETFLVGEVDEEGKHLVQTTYECLEKAIEICRPGTRYREVGNVIEKHAKENGCSVVRTYCGHGVGRLFHCAPNVPHYAKNKAVGVMDVGHTFTIEPMICEGTWRDQLWPDNWTSTTKDGKRSAQFEHTLLITEDGVEVLTRRTNGTYIDRFDIPHEIPAFDDGGESAQ